MIECESRASFPLSFCGPISMTRTIAQIDIGKYGIAFVPSNGLLGLFYSVSSVY